MTSVLVGSNNNQVVGRLTARPVKKIDRPRMLKMTGSGIPFHSGESGLASCSSAEEVISFLDAFIEMYSSKSNEHQQDLPNIIISLCGNLKVYGTQLESLYKDQLDRGFYHLRNASRDAQLDLLTRLHLLEVIELRASRWMTLNDPVNYYQQKLSQAEETQMLDYTQRPASPNSMPQGSAPSPPPPATPLMLQAGEVLKSSGKYTAASKVPGKNFVKDEVVIRNSDSGKVMGIKGRRVHLIEEISDTVISFQRVNPGAKERLVQITGAAEENIDRARALMEETIRRNASPVRSNDMPTSPSFDQSSGSIMELDENRNAGMKMNRSASMVEGSLDKFLYTVNVGGQYIKITGNNLNLVQTAKLVLDEYFSATADQERNLCEGSPNSSDEGVVLSLQNSPRPSENNQSDRETRRSYSRAYLLLLGKSPYSVTAPELLPSLAAQFPEIVRKDKERFNVEQYLKQYPEQFSAENIVVSSSTE